MEQTFLEIRTFVASHPAVLLAGAVALVWTASRVWGTDRITRWVQRAAVGAAAAYAAIVVGAWATPTYVDHVEPTVVSTAAALVAGRDLYPVDRANGAHALPYGPVLYGWLGAWGATFGFGVASIKTGLTLIWLAGMACVAAALRRVRPGWRADWCLTVATCGAFGSAPVWARAESSLLAVVALGMLAATTRSWMSAWLFGASLGLAAGIKITGVLFLLPLVPAIIERAGAWRTIVWSPVIAAVVLFAPFFHPAIQLSGFLEILRLAGGQGFRPRAIATGAEWATLLILPAVVMWWGSRTRARVAWQSVSLLALAGAVIAVLASKIGAGPYYFLPLVPVAIFVAGETADRRLGVVRHAATCTAIALLAVQGAYWWGYGRDAHGVRAEAEAVARRREYGASVAVGYGPRYRLSFARPVLGGSHEAYPFDAVTLMEYQLAGRDGVEVLAGQMRRCATENWLLPKNGAPFDLPNAYVPDRQVFPESFKAAFRDHYAIVASGDYFDVWRCRTP